MIDFLLGFQIKLHHVQQSCPFKIIPHTLLHLRISDILAHAPFHPEKILHNTFVSQGLCNPHIWLFQIHYTFRFWIIPHTIHLAHLSKSISQVLHTHLDYQAILQKCILHFPLIKLTHPNRPPSQNGCILPPFFRWTRYFSTPQEYDYVTR